MEDVSPVFRTEPQGLRGQAWFSNCVARIRTALGPEALLATLAGIEARLGRVRELKWGPRTIDLDILLLGVYKNSWKFEGKLTSSHIQIGRAHV